jgi:hypothetical protein
MSVAYRQPPGWNHGAIVVAASIASTLKKIFSRAASRRNV